MSQLLTSFSPSLHHLTLLTDINQQNATLFYYLPVGFPQAVCEAALSALCNIHPTSAWHSLNQHGYGMSQLPSRGRGNFRGLDSPQPLGATLTSTRDRARHISSIFLDSGGGRAVGTQCIHVCVIQGNEAIEHDSDLGALVG